MSCPCGGNTKGGDGCRCDPPFVVPLPWDKPPLNSNDRMHWAVRARIVKEIRETVAVVCQYHDAPKGLDRVAVSLNYQPSTHRKRDADNWPTLKAAIDGMVDYGVIPDDNTAHVVEATYRVHPVRRDKGGQRGDSDDPRLWLEITTHPMPDRVLSQTPINPGGTRGN